MQINSDQSRKCNQFCCPDRLIGAIQTNMSELIPHFAEPLASLAQPESSECQYAVATLREFIAKGSYGGGDRLPAEREMIGTLGMRRSTLRKALNVLEREGAIWRHVGKGTFVAGQTDTSQLGVMAVLSQQMTPLRMMQARLCIEPSLAREAAIHASRDAITRINRFRTAAREATNWVDYEAQDDLFHRAIAESSDNMLLLLLFDQLNHVRRTVAGSSVVRNTQRPPREHTSFAEHDEITTAIEARDPAAAQQAMRRHIGSVSDRLFGQD